MRELLTKGRTILALGLPSIARAAGYRLGIGLGMNPVRRLSASSPQGPFFLQTELDEPIAAPAVQSWGESARLFGRWPLAVSAQPPDWLTNPFTGKRVPAPERDWWQIPDFDPAVGDIKIIWELSRMDWALAFAQRVRNGDCGALQRLNDWLADWCTHNPPYKGPNWKCGQEASIRVMHLCMAALLLRQTQHPAPGLHDLIRVHLRRIAPTVQYAMAQDNNHGTSEAAALFIGGSWLAKGGDAQGRRWEHQGRRWLENRAARLIGLQGSFSQYSLNYHRLMLDTLSLVEVWRRRLSLPPFSAGWQARALAAAQWLRHMITPVTGDGPNVGANDGANLLQLTDTPYRDYRPSVQLAMALFARERAYSAVGPWSQPLTWLGERLPVTEAPPAGSYLADDGGFAVLRRGAAMAMLRYPRFRFRPGQADALHLDLWLEGENLLRDDGSYSYNAEPRWQAYFGGTASHNTVQFDDRDQMPRLSRFLLGDWLRTDWIHALREEGESVHFGAGYRDRRGASHRRRVQLSDATLRVEDDIGGFARKAVLRWRLRPGSWELRDALHSPCVVDATGRRTVTVRADMPFVRCELTQGWESRHYLEKTPVTVLEVEVRQPGVLTTEVNWSI